jgi:hypothetical protein
LQNQPPAKHAESLSGLIERVTFFSEDSGYAVLKVIKGVNPFYELTPFRVWSAAFTPLQLPMLQELFTLKRRKRRAPVQGFNP